MNPLLYPIILPTLLGILCYLIPKSVKGIREFIALFGSAATFGLTIWLFSQKPLEWTVGQSLILRLDNLSSWIVLTTGLFGLLLALYSVKFMQGKEKQRSYYGSFLWTLGAAVGALMANHLVLLLIFWGFLGVTLYLLVQTGGEKAGHAARKTLVIVGGTDALMLFGIVLIFIMNSTWEMHKVSLAFNSFPVYAAFICLALGAFAKAGAMPLHTWIPEVSEAAPVAATAYLPAALDKLLGIYLLGRMCLTMFQMTVTMNLILMIIGAVTIIAAVMMALIQHDFRRLLAYHAVSQVGYMILGIGTGHPIGIAGGLFHMLNNSIYKAGLFLTAGAVQQKTGTTNLDKLGGLGRLMPFTFASFLIAAFAISGIPPFNGFVSKWMVYQGLVELGQSGDKLWVIWLAAAMFGSGLTIASFMKLTHSVFLGVPSARKDKSVKEVGIAMALPMVVLAMLCVVFGIFAHQLPIKQFLSPAVPGFQILGLWSPGLATIMVFVGLLVGLIIYLMGNIKGVREAESFIGGESLPVESRVTGTGFYNTIKDYAFFKKFYGWAKAKYFDVYEQLDHYAIGFSSFFKKIHTGILNFYISWVLMGLAILLIVMMGR